MPHEISPARARQSDDVALMTLAQLFYLKRRLIVSVGVTLMLLVVGITMIRPRTYTSEAVFMPQAPETGLSQVAGLAAQFGFTMAATEASSSPAFYVSLLKSRDVLRGAVTTSYVVNDSIRGTLIDLYEVSGKTPGARRDAAVDALLDDMEVTTGAETGMITLEISTPWSSLSKQVADRLLVLVSQLNLHIRQAKAGAERRFVEGRVKDAQVNLRTAEDRLKGFLQRNREFRLSPELTFENDRLRRDVQLTQQVYETLAQAYEKARIDEVRNTPGITVITSPDLPVTPDSRRTVLKGLLALFAGLAGATFLVAFRQGISGAFGSGQAQQGERRIPMLDAASDRGTSAAG